MPSPLELDVIRVLLTAATVITAWWVVQYTLSSPWWRDKVGRSFIWKDLFLLALLVPACLLQLWPRLFTAYEEFWIDVVTLGGIAAVVAARCALFWRIQRPRPATMWRVLRGRGSKDESDGAPS